MSWACRAREVTTEFRAYWQADCTCYTEEMNTFSYETAFMSKERLVKYTYIALGCSGACGTKRLVKEQGWLTTKDQVANVLRFMYQLFPVFCSISGRPFSTISGNWFDNAEYENHLFHIKRGEINKNKPKCDSSKMHHPGYQSSGLLVRDDGSAEGLFKQIPSACLAGGLSASWV